MLHHHKHDRRWALLELDNVFYKSSLHGASRALAFQVIEKFVAGVHGAGIEQAVVPELDHNESPAPVHPKYIYMYINRDMGT
jgi:hypothetical protein